ncbi:MAG: hypothetical protein QME96_04750, partial [Myxococcota bacterium]|nr:hypothetical protein [Myxococcota bacterium]
RPSGESAARPLVVSVAVPSAAGGRPGRFVVVPTARIVEPEHAALEGNAAALAALVAWAADVQAVFGVAAGGP